MTATAYLHHATTGRIHVAYFTLAPFPGEDQLILRWLSRGHHTTGAETQVEAEAHMAALHDALGLRSCDVPDLGHVQWDGEIPIVIFGTQPYKVAS